MSSRAKRRSVQPSEASFAATAASPDALFSANSHDRDYYALPI